LVFHLPTLGYQSTFRHSRCRWFPAVRIYIHLHWKQEGQILYLKAGYGLACEPFLAFNILFFYFVIMKLILATNNQHKVEEIRHAIGSAYELMTLREAGINIDIPEPYGTLEENASAKSKTIYEITGLNCFGEDTGLEVMALNGEPGVKSARYAGDEKSFDKNIEKLLDKLKDKTDRTAHFRTVISLLMDGKETQFEGICQGKIIYERKGDRGFGYDPVFIPNGSDKSFAEMELAEKDRFSHRAKAVAKLVTFLSHITGIMNRLESKSEN